MDPVVLRTERLVLSVPTLDDVDAITASCQDELLRDMLASLPWPYTRADAEYFVDQIVPAGWASGDAPVWGIRDADGGPHLGSIGWRRELPFRDGSHPLGWHAVLERDARAVSAAGWPL